MTEFDTIRPGARVPLEVDLSASWLLPGQQLAAGTWTANAALVIESSGHSLTGGTALVRMADGVTPGMRCEAHFAWETTDGDGDCTSIVLVAEDC